jgi:hypothetical protein
MLSTSGNSSAYIFSSDSTARKARMTCLHADSIVPLDHGQFAVVKICLAMSSFCTRRTTSFLKWLPVGSVGQLVQQCNVEDNECLALFRKLKF